MNASRLTEIVAQLLELDTKFQIQTRLNEANSQLQNIISQPQQANFQTQFSNTIEQLRGAYAHIGETLQPTQISLIKEIGGDKFFVVDLAALIDDWVQRNRVTPAVTQQSIQQLLGERQNYIDQITRLRDSLRAVGIEATTLVPGDAEIGFLLPRELFNNELGSLIKELGEIRFVLRAFSEVATGDAEPIKVRQISTSDPLFFFQVSPTTIALFGGVITWALNTWSQVEGIRKVRAETRKLNLYTEKEIEDMYDKKIISIIEDAVTTKTEELVAQIKEKSERSYEQHQQLKMSLASILERIERGMTVEIRYLPPPTTTDSERTTSAETVAFDSLSKITPQLVFPKTAERPVLQLSHAEQKLTPQSQDETFNRDEADRTGLS